MFERAKQQGWEGLIGKRADSCYRVGKRSPDWVKLKLVRTQEFVVGGWTEPRGARSAFGALLLGVYERRRARVRGPHWHRLRREGAARVAALMTPLETPESPFRVRPRPNERPHWIRPELVARGEVHGVDSRRQAAAPHVSRACATTSTVAGPPGAEHALRTIRGEGRGGVTVARARCRSGPGLHEHRSGAPLGTEGASAIRPRRDSSRCSTSCRTSRHAARTAS